MQSVDPTSISCVTLEPPIEVFVDFDGTITNVDTHEVLMRHFAGDRAFEEVQKRLSRGEITLRESLDLQVASVRDASFDDVDALLAREAGFDPGFPAFTIACTSQGIRVTIVSSGMKPVIQRALTRHGISNVPIIAGNVDPNVSGWRMHWPDESPNGIDKAHLVRAAQARGCSVVLIGDGPSDYEAARAADRRFARRGRDLEKYLAHENVPYSPFDSFQEITIPFRPSTTS
jgi:2,3-diketo-5-methylthio-1-phosphopentane phosphatase